MESAFCIANRLGFNHGEEMKNFSGWQKINCYCMIYICIADISKVYFIVAGLQTIIYGPLAQSAEHLTFNQGVPRSNRGWLTNKNPWEHWVPRVFILSGTKMDFQKSWIWVEWEKFLHKFAVINIFLYRIIWVCTTSNNKNCDVRWNIWVWISGLLRSE